MSYLCTIIELIQNLSLEDEEISNLLKEIDEMNRDNTKLNSQLEEFEREHVRLQIEHHNLETITSFINVSAIENLNHASQKMYKDCVELKSLIDKIDFTKILRCHHMEMEAKCRKEWQPIEDCFVKTLNWHEKMEQRHIVQKYRQAEVSHREAEDANKNQLKTMKESLKQSVELVNQARGKRNNLVIVLIKGSKDLDDFNAKIMKLDQYQVYIENLRQEKLRIQNKLDQIHIKTFNPILCSNGNQISALAITSNREISNFIMPKFPSFSDILERFNQVEKLTSVTAIENSNSFCVKSILHTSKKSITTKQTKNVHFKVQLEEYQEEITEIETETENNEEEVIMEINEPQDSGENLQEMKDLENSSDIETINLLTPADNTLMEETKDYLDNDNNTKQIANNSKIEIQDCVIFKAPFPVKEYIQDTEEQDKENISNNLNLNCSKQSTELCSSSSSHKDIKEILNTTKKSFFEEFLNFSSSSESSPKKTGESSEKCLNQKMDIFAAMPDANKYIEINETVNNFEKNNSTEIQDFLDFGCNKGFTFDSDDNMGGNSYNTGNMDFM